MTLPNHSWNGWPPEKISLFHLRSRTHNINLLVQTSLLPFFLNGCIFITVITFTRCSLLKSAVKGEGQKHGNDVRATLKWLLETKSIALCYCWEISNTFESFWAKSGFIFNQNSTVYEDLDPLRYSKCCSNIQSVHLPQISRGPFQTQLLCDINEVREY